MNVKSKKIILLDEVFEFLKDINNDNKNIEYKNENEIYKKIFYIKYSILKNNYNIIGLEKINKYIQ